MTMTQNDAKRLIMTNRDLSQKHRDPYETLAEQGYKQYLGWRKKLGKNEKRSNLHIPVSYRIVDTIRAREVKAIAGGRPFCEPVVKPGPNVRPELMALNEQKAKIPAALIDQQLITNKFTSIVYDWSTAKLIFPYAVLGVCWKYEEEKRKQRVQAEFLGIKLPYVVTKEETEILFDDNELFYVDLMDYWYDPWGGSQDVFKHKFGIHREWLTRDEIEQRLEFYKAQGVGKVFMPTDAEWRAISDIAVPDNRFGRFSETDQIEPSNEGIDANDRPGNNSRNRRYAVYNHWTRDQLVILINDNFVPFIGDNPFWRHKQIPFAMQSFERLPGEVVGRSALHFIYHLQEEVNTQRNQRIDNVSLTINCMFKMRKGCGLTPNDLVVKPGGVIELEDMGDIEQMLWQDTTGTSVREDQITIKEMEDTLGSPAITQGIEAPGSQTATEITSQNSNASIRIDVKLMLWTEPWERIFGLMDMNNQQLITDRRLIEMFDEQGIRYWKEMGPLDIIGFERDYTLANAKIDPAANKEIRRQQIWNAIVEGKKVGLTLDYEALTVEYLKTLDLPNAAKFKLSPEQIQQQAQAAMQQQTAQQQQIVQQKQSEEQQKFQQDIVKMVLQTIAKVVEKNPALLNDLSQLNNTLLQGGDAVSNSTGNNVPQ